MGGVWLRVPTYNEKKVCSYACTLKIVDVPMSTLSNIDLPLTDLDHSPAEIDHTKTLSSDFARLYVQTDLSDLQLIIESECFYVHRIVLAARSQYFRALLYGGMKESQEINHRIELKDCQVGSFKILLQYIYTGKICLRNEKVIF